jgi:hypothetical protein
MTTVRFCERDAVSVEDDNLARQQWRELVAVPDYEDLVAPLSEVFGGQWIHWRAKWMTRE